jgi:hypothetical protein
MENIFAAAELTAKGHLMLMPDERLLDTKSHKFIGAEANRQARYGNLPRDFVDVLNKVTRERGVARYVAGSVSAEGAEMEAMSLAVTRTLSVLTEKVPKRFAVGENSRR